MMRRRLSFALALALSAVPFAARAADAPAAPTPAPAANAAEATFLASMMRELPRRYATTQAAAKAGYVRYTNEDNTGAISWVNVAAWNSPDAAHPAQLWYDAKGRLIGADYSVVRAPDATQPVSVLGMQATRDVKIGAHVHYVTCDAMHMCTYGKAIGAKKYAEANGAGSEQHPTADGLVKAGAVKDAATVKAVFLYQPIFDVPVWVVANPLGQFAEKNPSVHPSPNAGKGEDEM